MNPAMWWIVGIWLGLAVVGAAVFHRVRSRLRPVAIPPGVVDFLRAFEVALAAQQAAVVELRGMARGRFVAVLGVAGQDVLLPLRPLFLAWREDRGTLAWQLEHALRGLVAGDLASVEDHALADVIELVLPQVRSAAWVTAQAPAFGDSALVSRPLSADLRVCYVIDSPASMVFVTRAHLRAWRIDEESLHRTASANLRQRGSGELPMPEADSAPVLIQVGDGYDATRVLLLDPDKAEGLLVAIPERDALWMGNAGDTDLARLMEVNRAQSEASTHPVSASIYRMCGGDLVPLSASDAGEASSM